MYQTKTVRAMSKAQSHGVPPVPPLYHWLGADAERVADEAMVEAKITPFYHWLGADAEEVVAVAAV